MATVNINGRSISTLVESVVLQQRIGVVDHGHRLSLWLTSPTALIATRIGEALLVSGSGWSFRCDGVSPDEPARTDVLNFTAHGMFLVTVNKLVDDYQLIRAQAFGPVVFDRADGFTESINRAHLDATRR